MNQIKKHAKVLTAAVEGGVDPIDVQLDDSSKAMSKPKGSLSMKLDFVICKHFCFFLAPFVDAA
jgi:hypothetical protein